MTDKTNRPDSTTKAREIISSLDIGTTGPHNWKGDPQARRYSVSRKTLIALEGIIAAALEAERKAGAQDKAFEWLPDLRKAETEGYHQGLEDAAEIVRRECGNGCGEDHRKYIEEQIRGKKRRN